MYEEQAAMILAKDKFFQGSTDWLGGNYTITRITTFKSSANYRCELGILETT